MTDQNSQTRGNGLTYADAGVSIDAGNALVNALKPLAKSTVRAGANSELGGFGGLFDLKAAGFKDPLLVAANDGVGTKLNIAFETGRHDTVGIDLVAMCVNDLVVQGAEPLFFLDYFATGRLSQEQGVAVVAGIAEGCRQAGTALIGGETAEMPGMYEDGEYDLAGFSVGAVERGQVLPRNDMHEGDVLLGLASDGLHSNGFSLVRKIVERSGLDYASDAPFSRDVTLGAALLCPTRIYVLPLLNVLQNFDAVKGMAHITGGGLTENVPRMLPESLSVRIDLDAIRPHDVFGWIARSGGVADADMLKTFNCGVGMVLVVDGGKADAVASHLQSLGESVSVIGDVVSRQGPSVVEFQNTLGLS